MKRIILAFLLVAPATLGWATDYYIVGDATPWGWVTGDDRNNTKMTETSSGSGIYVWTGLLKHGGDGSGNGFIICTDLTNWACYGASANQTTIADTGSDTYTSKDNKWNPTNTDWQYYTITLNTNTSVKKVYWEAGKSFVPDGEGFYNIADGTDLYWFSVLVEKVDRFANAKLTADIGYNKAPIGTYVNNYAGFFDGQEHTVTLDITTDQNASGLFGAINGATIKNLVVDGTVTTTHKWVGGLGGLSYGNTTTIENIVVKTAISFTGSGDYALGGLFGDIENSPTVKNCAFYGSISAANNTTVGGLVGWCGASTQFTNCIVAAASISAKSPANYAKGSGFSTSNCVKVAGNDAKLASGELCYTLNNGGANWYQTLAGSSPDTHPLPFNTHASVYRYGDPYYYTNIASINESTSTATIASSIELAEFARLVNNGKTTMNANVTADIDYTEYPQGFIGTSSNKYAGTFNGREHHITLALVGDARIRGLFAFINGATIRNLVVDGSIESDYNNIGGLGGQVDGSSTVENVVVNTSISYTGSDSDSSCGGFFPYVNNDQTLNLRNCAFYGSIHTGTATGNAGLVGWNSGTINATNCIVAPAVLETGSNGFDDYARYHASTRTNCYRVETDDARFASGELCYLLNNGGTNWYQTLGTEDIYPYPFGTLTVGRGQWLSDDYLYYNIDGSGNITIPQLNLSENDTKYDVPANVTAKSISITRDIPAGQWIGLCLPFDYDIPSGWDVRELAYVNGTGDGASMIFRSATSIEAGKPYLIKPTSRVETITLTDTDTPVISQADATAANTVSDAGVNMIGNLCKTAITEGSYYINTSSLLKKLTATSANLKGFRAYFTVDAAGGGSLVKALSYGFEDDDATSINEELRMKNDESEAAIYNLAGQRLNKAQNQRSTYVKGINIVNGKKILF